jgi:hypothetical protein
MAYAIVHHFPGGTKAQYEASLAAVHPSKTTLPKGQMFHIAGPTKGGYTVVAIHDTKQSWEQFRDKILHPKLKAGIPGGFATPAVETEFEVENSLAANVAGAAAGLGSSVLPTP